MEQAPGKKKFCREGKRNEMEEKRNVMEERKARSVDYHFKENPHGTHKTMRFVTTITTNAAVFVTNQSTVGIRAFCLIRSCKISYKISLAASVTAKGVARNSDWQHIYENNYIVRTGQLSYV